ncbi:hypothetical protein IQ13_4143 [Lacibacter cauensis]|uniref:Lipoprotein n=1 Tax=Lacibacter cauensis TaxID=510947 RepID=A0A562S9M0_9BACT|nr:hypothetical protein [Lacibacter cauensis]TWI77903.1 hypothetical protein IQ13_4143 [Lacibacter cauensis]
MRNVAAIFFSLLFFLFLGGCSFEMNNTEIKIEDNALIEQMYKKDIEIRELDAKTDTVNLEEYDKKHREQIFRLLSENKVVTPKDKLRAAWILQHTVARICDGELTSLSPENFLLAYSLSSSALATLEKNNDTALIRKQYIPRIVALNYDRYLLFTFGYQKFGTQFVFDDQTGETLLAPIDTTLTSDEERKKYNVEPLPVLLKQYKMKPIGKK